MLFGKRKSKPNTELDVQDSKVKRFKKKGKKERYHPD